MLRQFGQVAPLRPRVDLRPQFRALELHAKDQGRRPSCAVFAVVSALEYLHAEATGSPEKLSEEYLIWATLRTVRRTQPGAEVTGEDADAGFALTEVVTALRSYGIPPSSALPNTLGRADNVVAAPPESVIAAARQRTRVAVHPVPGRDNATRLNNVVHALNADIPVAIGTAWPRFRNMRAALLNSQEPIPGYGHAVTLVGYTTETGRIEDAVFIFKNSWGGELGRERLRLRHPCLPREAPAGCHRAGAEPRRLRLKPGFRRRGRGARGDRPAGWRRRGVPGARCGPGRGGR
jgi:hypothetical protein